MGRPEKDLGLVVYRWCLPWSSDPNNAWFFFCRLPDSMSGMQMPYTAQFPRYLFADLTYTYTLVPWICTVDNIVASKIQRFWTANQPVTDALQIQTISTINAILYGYPSERAGAFQKAVVSTAAGNLLVMNGVRPRDAEATPFLSSFTPCHLSPSSYGLYIYNSICLI